MRADSSPALDVIVRMDLLHDTLVTLVKKSGDILRVSPVE